ncbi:MAG: PucR family transcriptional regulator [Solirubrobacterales bacterium]
MLRRSPHSGVAAIVARIPRTEAGREMTAAFGSDIAAFERLPARSRDDVLEGVEGNLQRWWRWLSTGTTPTEGDFDPLREWARARASEGVRLEDLLKAFWLGGQVGWELIRRHARPDESEVLLDAAGLLMRYVDQISTVVADTYLAEREVLVSEEERRTRSLLDRINGGEPLGPADLELAERLGVPVQSAYAPFAIVMPGRPPGRHAALAARLRQRGWRLAVTEGDRVVGLTWRPLEPGDLDEGADVVFAIAEPLPRSELADARADLVLLAEHARRLGLRGVLRAEDHLLEILILRSPTVAARLRGTVLAPLAEPEHAELRRTLDALLRAHFDRAATSAALHVHRNTLAYRLRRIEEITGLDLASPRDLARLYLAAAIDVEEGSEA